MSELKLSQPRLLRLLDATLISCVLLLTFLFGCFRQKDADIWWHLKAGQTILDRNSLPDKDWFTFTSSDRDWIDLHWLFQIAAAGLHAAGGMRLLTLVSASLGTAAVALLLTARRGDWSVPAAVACWVPWLFLLSGRFYVRPEMVTLLCISIFLTVLFHASDRPWLLWILIPVQILWVNVQGLFILGPLIIGLYWLDGLWCYWRGQGGIPLSRRTWLLLGLVAACLANPYHIRGLMFPVELFRKMAVPADAQLYSKHIGELQSILQFIDQAGIRQFYVIMHFALMAIAIASFLFPWSQGRFDLFRLLLFGSFTWLGFQATRNSGQFAIIGATVTAWNIGEWVARRRRSKVNTKSGASWSNHTRLRLFCRLGLQGVLVILVWLVVGGSFYRFAGEGRLFGLGEHPLWHAHGAARFAAQPEMPDRLLAFHLGHAAMFEFHKRDDQRTFCDPRLEVISRDLFQQYHELEYTISIDAPGWSASLARQNLRMVMVDHHTHHALEAVLMGSSDWLCVHFDPVAGIYIQRQAADQAGIGAIDFGFSFFALVDRSVNVHPTRLVQFSSESDPTSSMYLAESLYLVARGLAEHPQSKLESSRWMLLMATKLACDSKADTADQQFRRLRLLGQISLQQALVQRQRPTPSDRQWEPFTMLNLARARRLLERAQGMRPDDIMTLLYLYNLAAVQGDSSKETELYARILRHRDRTPTERELIARVRANPPQQAAPAKDLQSDLGAIAVGPTGVEDSINRLIASGEFDAAAAIIDNEPIRLPANSQHLVEQAMFLELYACRQVRLHSLVQSPLADGETQSDRDRFLGDMRLVGYPLGETLDSAAHCYRQALAGGSTSAQVHWGLVHALVELGDARGATLACEVALQGTLSEAMRLDLEWILKSARGFLNRAETGPSAGAAD